MAVGLSACSIDRCTPQALRCARGKSGGGFMGDRKVHLGLRVSPEFKEALGGIADMQGVTMTDIVVSWVTDRMRSLGFVTEEGVFHGIPGSRNKGVAQEAASDL
jgi:hypothetical protein